MKQYHLIAERNLAPRDVHGSEWPKVIAYSFTDRSFLFLEGKGHGFMGAEVQLNETSLDRWQDLFIDLDAQWFLDLLNQRLKALQKATCNLPHSCILQI
jgi:hypothetical protein